MLFAHFLITLWIGLPMVAILLRFDVFQDALAEVTAPNDPDFAAMTIFFLVCILLWPFAVAWALYDMNRYKK